MKNQKWFQLLTIFILVKLGVHFYLNGQWSFHRDELLYLALGRHLDWGYASVPAGIGFWAWFGSNILGGSVWAIRLIATIFGTGTVLLTGLMAKELLPKNEDQNNGQFAILLIGIAGLTAGAYLRPCMLFMPVVFDIFYWTLLCWLFLKYISTEKSWWLLLFGLVTGIGLLNKYTVFMFLFAMVGGILLTKRFSLFSEKNFYLAAIAALLIFLPNIIWQAKHHFPVIHHMTELSKTQFAHVSLGSFFSDQMRFFLPALPVWISGLYYLLFHREGKKWKIYGLIFIIALSILLAFNAKSYYSLGAYPVLIAAGAVFLEIQTKTQIKWLRYVLPLFMVLIGVATIPASMPILPPIQEAKFVKNLTSVPGLQGILRWEDGHYYSLPQDFADMLGWEELGVAVKEIWQSIPDKTNAAVFADSYGQAGAIEHFGKLNGVLSFNDNYRYWLPDSLPHSFHTLIYVNDELGDDMPEYFQKIEKLWELNMPLSRQHGNQIYKCEQPTPAFFERMNKAFYQAKNGGDIED